MEVLPYVWKNILIASPRFLFTWDKRENRLNSKTNGCLHASLLFKAITSWISLLLFAKHPTPLPGSAKSAGLLRRQGCKNL